jgi:hypothetical protein
MGLIASYNLRSMTVRKGTAAMTAMGIAMVVAVFVMTMAIAQGFNGALVASGSNENAILLRKGATSETVSGVLRTQLPLIQAMPQVARASDGHPMASPELVDGSEGCHATRAALDYNGPTSRASRSSKVSGRTPSLAFASAQKTTGGLSAAL